jgi:hypothetical protein
MPPKPNVNARVREVGWWWGTTNGSATNTSGSGIGHGTSPALAAGATALCFPIQSTHALLGGASVFSRGFVFPVTLEPTRNIDQVFNSHGMYLEITAHLRSAGDVDLPGQLRIFHNDLWPTAAAVPAAGRLDLGDWRTNQWQEWEEWSPISIPTAPPGFTGGGAAGTRYEYRRKLGRIPANFFFAQLTNAGSVAAAEWGFGVYLRSHA